VKEDLTVVRRVVCRLSCHCILLKVVARSGISQHGRTGRTLDNHYDGEQVSSRQQLKSDLLLASISAVVCNRG